VGKETFRLCQQLVDGMVTVSNDEICAAIKDTFEDTRSVLEPAGALALAGCKKFIAQLAAAGAGGAEGRRYVCVTSGANMNFNRLRFVAERAELGEEREAMLAVTVKEEAGEFMRLYEALGCRNVTEFSYRYGDEKEAHIYVSFEVKERRELQDVISGINSRGMTAIDISHNDMAKDHTVSSTAPRQRSSDSQCLTSRYHRPHPPSSDCPLSPCSHLAAAALPGWWTQRCCR
jgi:threonine dehydratase